MKQCSKCQRFLSKDVDTCPYCGGCESVSNVLSPERDNELSNYKIVADGVSIGNRDYRIIDAIGQGSHGVVLKVEDGDGKCYALKVPFRFNELFSNSQGNKQSVLDMSHKYISHEIKILGNIHSDALIRIIYAGPVRCRRGETTAELPAILMEQAEGTLKDIIDGQVKNRLALPYEEKENIIEQLTVDLEKLHAKGLVHRDLSPHNVFAVDREKEIRYVLADFGASKAAAGHENRDSTTKLAFHDRYLDPALLIYDHLRYDSRIDIYQLGIIITEVLLGEYWQADDNELSISDFHRVDFEKNFLLTLARYEIPPVLLKRIRKATTLNIRRRYRGAAEFRKEIHKALETVRKKEKKSPKRTIAVSFNHPGMVKRKRPIKKGYIAALVSVILLFAGIQIHDRLLKPTPAPSTTGIESLQTTDRYGMTPLHHAVIRTDMNEIKGLVTGGASVNAQDNYGWTPLHWAVFLKNAGICRFLLENGANPTIKTQKKWFKYPAGLTAIQMAELIEDPVILKQFSFRVFSRLFACSADPLKGKK